MRINSVAIVLLVLYCCLVFILARACDVNYAAVDNEYLIVEYTHCYPVMIVDNYGTHFEERCVERMFRKELK